MKILLINVLLGINIIISAMTIQDGSLILGTWVQEESSGFKRIFKADGKCYEYYGGQLQDTYYYSIKKSGQMCSIQISEKPNISYLTLTNTMNSNDKYCYEILSLNEEYLQLRYFNRGGSLLFRKQ